MGSVFISYRRENASGFALTLYKELSRCFKADEVFYDQEDRHHIRYGDDWFEKIRAALGTVKVFLAVIGPGWLHAVDEHGNRRLWQEDDVVRWEIEEALKRQENGELKIIPVFVNGAGFPKNPSELPSSLVDLTKSQACPLSANPADFDSHFERLLECITAVPGIPKPLPTARQSRIFHTIDHNLTKFFSDPADNLPLLYTTLHETGRAAVTASAATAALHGMGGVGKTQLALKYSWDFRDEYAGVWWFRADDLGRLQQDCQQFCERCGVKVNTGEEHHQAVKRWLQEQPRWLLVYDNAEIEYGEEKAHLTPYLPNGDHHIIITARSPELGDGAATIALDVWTEEQALPFLLKRLPSRNEAELRLLCRTLDGLPLALEQACAYLLKTGNTVQVYCEAIENLLRSESYLARRDSQQTDYPLSVMATLSISFDKLSEAARQLLRLCAWCAPEAIPELLFRVPALSWVRAQEEHIELNKEQEERLQSILPDMLRSVAKDELRWGETVAELSGFALAQRVVVDLSQPGKKESVVDKALLLHRLTQMVVIHHLCPNTFDASSLTNLISLMFPKDVEASINWPLCNILSPHLLHLASITHQISLPLAPIGTLLNSAAQYFRYRVGLYAEAGVLFEQNIQLSSNLFGPDHPNTHISKNNLASALLDLGNLEGAKTLQEEVLKRRKELLSFDHPDTLTSMNNLAATLKAMGDLNGAKALHEQVLERSKDLHGPDHPNTLSSMNNLASVRYDMGDYEGAKELQEQVVRRRTEILGADHPDTLASISNLAEVLKDTGHSERANELRIRVFERRVELFGVDHPDTLSSMNSLAETLWDLGQKQRSRTMLEQVLQCFREKLGPNHHKTSTSAWNLFTILNNIGDHAAAQAVINEHLAWLLADDIELQSAAQQQVRDMLCQVVKGGEEA